MNKSSIKLNKSIEQKVQFDLFKKIMFIFKNID